MARNLRLLPTVLVFLALLAACAGRNPGSLIENTNLIPPVKDTNSQVFHFSDGSQKFQVPSGVDKITITAKGAGTPSARGGMVKARISVHPGDELTIFVGGEPHGMFGGYNGGGDGGACALEGGCSLRGGGAAGASDVRSGGNTLDDRILVAGGAGGRGGPGTYHGGPGGEGGGPSGIRGNNGLPVGSPHGSYGRVDAGGGGGGGTQRRGGNGGAAGTIGYIPGNAGSAGMVGIGGTGADDYCEICSISYGLLAGGSGGGGGGGYYGGGGGGSGASSYQYVYQGRKALGSGGGGGGGSSFVEPGAQNVTIEAGKGNSGNGLIVISW